MGKKQTAPPPAKLPYRRPVLAVYGNLQALTAAKSGSMDDAGGKPRTRATGMPA